MLKPTVKPRAQNRLHIDPVLMLACFSLLGIGFMLVTSSSLHLGVKMADDISHYPFKQLIHIAFGLGFSAVILNIPMQSWERMGQTLFIAGLRQSRSISQLC